MSNNQKVGETDKLEKALEKVATNIANQSVKSTLILVGTALESALKQQVKTEDGSVRQLNTREILIVLANTIGAFLKNMEQAEQENQEQPKEN